MTVQLPAAIAGASIWPKETNGTFQGTMTPMTPYGSSRV
jgi:hypothetical protein